MKQEEPITQEEQSRASKFKEDVNGFDDRSPISPTYVKPKKVSRWRQRKWRIWGIIGIFLIIGTVCCAYAGIKIQQQNQQNNNSASTPEPTENVVKAGFEAITSKMGEGGSGGTTTTGQGLSETGGAVATESA